MKEIILAGAVLVLGCLPASASTNCAKIDKDIDRLACYDAENGRTPTTSTNESDGTAWQSISRKSELTDEKSVFLMTRSTSPVTCRWGEGRQAVLTVRCLENKTSLIFDIGCHMTSSEYNDYGDVDIRLDSNPARTVAMVESTDNKSLGLWSGGKSIPLIKSMFGKSELIARMTPFNESPMILHFKVNGLEQVIKPLREACHW